MANVITSGVKGYVNDASFKKLITALSNVDNPVATKSIVRAGIYTGMHKTVRIFQGAWNYQPPRKPGAFAALASPAQKRAVWAKYKNSGAFKNGYYQRTRRLLNSMNSTVDFQGDDIIGKVGVDADYGEFVIWSAGQQNFHKATGWLTEQDALDQVEPDLNKLWSGVADKIVKTLGDI